MAISLVKGENINLTKTDGSLTHARIGLGWTAPTPGFDLDASAFLLSAAGKVASTSDFVFFNNRSSNNGAVKSSGDNKYGTGDGDDETLTVDLTAVPASVESIAIVVTIYEAKEREQNFGQVGDAYVRIINDNTGPDAEIARFDLDEDTSSSTAMVFGTLYRSGDDWKFKANASGSKLSLNDLAATYGAA